LEPRGISVRSTVLAGCDRRTDHATVGSVAVAGSTGDAA